MSENEWLISTDPAAMLALLTRKSTAEDTAWQPSNRKLRLFACGRCRMIWDKMAPINRKIVEAAEAYADGRRRRFYNPKSRSFEHRSPQAGELPHDDTWLLTIQTEFGESHILEAGSVERTYLYLPQEIQAGLLRDVFGNPFREVRIDSRYLIDALEKGWSELKFHADHWPQEEFTYRPHWARSPAVLSIAHTIYDERSFERMPILGDALEEAGCTERSIIDHCRGMCLACTDRTGFCWGVVAGCRLCNGTGKAGPHVRGCWVLDLMLGKS